MNTLFVAWKAKDSPTGPGPVWGPVGRLEFDDGVYRFYYTKGAQSVRDFQPFDGMKDLHQCPEQEVRMVVQRVNHDAPIQQRLLCRLQACWPAGFQPCEGENVSANPEWMRCSVTNERFCVAITETVKKTHS